MPSGQKVSNRRALEEWAEQSGETPGELEDLPELQAELEYLWEWFGALSCSRGSSGFGPLAITYSDIKAWAELMNEHPQPWEVETILALDSLFLRSIQGVTDGS